MAKKPLPTPDVLRQLLDYDPETGALTWRERGADMFSDNARFTAMHMCARWNTRWAGKPAFTSNDGFGYRQGHIFAGKYAAHRVAWAIHYDRWPEGDIDHINGDRADNRIANLREATRGENMQNLTVSHKNTSGFHGVNWDASRSKWLARITVNNQQHNLGRFDTAEEAAEAYRAAKARLHTFQPTVRE